MTSSGTSGYHGSKGGKSDLGKKGVGRDVRLEHRTFTRTARCFQYIIRIQLTNVVK